MAKGNAQQPPIAGTQGPGTVSRGLLGVREAARRDKKLRFTALLHHIDLPLLRASFEALKREASPGVDGVRWVAYREELDERLENLHERIHTGRYRALPSKRVCIPKDDGSERLLGIAALEDKVV
ncbi:MAG: group II intron reverse transcriptase/maturase, partial [Gammaproteobacteria bacterium]